MLADAQRPGRCLRSRERLNRSLPLASVQRGHDVSGESKLLVDHVALNSRFDFNRKTQTFPNDMIIKKIALVTGANKGIGLETARQRAKQGVTVLAGTRDEVKASQAAAELRKEVWGMGSRLNI